MLLLERLELNELPLCELLAILGMFILNTSCWDNKCTSSSVAFRCDDHYDKHIEWVGIMERVFDFLYFHLFSDRDQQHRRTVAVGSS
jgi:hypothetical protein